MKARDKCIEISIITRSHQAQLAQPSGRLKAQNQTVNSRPWASFVSFESWSSRTGGTDRCLSPRPECSSLGSRSQGAWVTLPAGAMAETLFGPHGSPAACYRDHWIWHAGFMMCHPPHFVFDSSLLVFVLASLPEDSRLIDKIYIFFLGEWLAHGNVQIISNAHGCYSSHMCVTRITHFYPHVLPISSFVGIMIHFYLHPHLVWFIGILKF